MKILDARGLSCPEPVILLRQAMGSYHEANYDAEMLIEHVGEAIDRAKSLDTNLTDRWPQTLGTRVYLLAESVMNRNY